MCVRVRLCVFTRACVDLSVYARARLHVCAHGCVCVLLPHRCYNGVHGAMLEQTLLKQA